MDKSDKRKRLAKRWLAHRDKPKSQSNEGKILARLGKSLRAPKTFLEFGFHPDAFNCAALVARGWGGLLVDGEQLAVEYAKVPASVDVMHLLVTLDNIGVLETRFPPGKLGVLSIDVDGNDYWFLERLLPALEPTIAVVEYNASFGLRPITVPYDADFSRRDKHQSGWYHGASLTALTELAARWDYRLVAVCDAGMNAFYARTTKGSSAEDAYRECVIRNEHSQKTAAEQWDAIKELPYITPTRSSPAAST